MAIGRAIDLTDHDKIRISEAVRAAESRTSAEIVPMLVARSGLYHDAQHRTGLALALLVLTALLMGEAIWLPWGWHAANAAWLIVATLTAYAVGAWVGTFERVIRAVTSTERLHQKVQLRAERAFARHGISRTHERTGVLLMVSLLEREVYLLPDTGIGSRVSGSATWPTTADCPFTLGHDRPMSVGAEGIAINMRLVVSAAMRNGWVSRVIPSESSTGCNTPTW